MIFREARHISRCRYHLQSLFSLPSNSDIIYKQFSHSSKTASTMLYDDMTDIESSSSVSTSMHFYDEVTSTMDTAREVMKNYGKNSDIPNIFTVVTDYQTKGRGTRGRTWKYGRGNLFMTIAVNRKAISIPMHYLPLRVGTLIASALYTYITDAQSIVKLKWPNDILINGRKVCGILIEMEDDHFLVGIGCNIVEAPPVTPDGNECGRPSTALIEHSTSIQNYIESLKCQNQDTSVDDSVSAQSKEEFPKLHRRLSKEIVAKFEDWIFSQSDSPARVLGDFSRNMDFSEQILRDQFGKPESRVIPLYLNEDGTLHVRYHDNTEGDLVAEYLY